MNKKFFTLIASALMLAGTVLNAQDAPIPKGTIAPLESGKKYQIALTTVKFLEDALQGKTPFSGTITTTPSAVTSYKAWLTTTGVAVSVDNAKLLYNALHTPGVVIPGLTEPGSSRSMNPLMYGWIDQSGNLRGTSWETFDRNGNNGGAKFYESIFCLTLDQVTTTGTAPLNVYSFANGFQLMADPKLATIKGSLPTTDAKSASGQPCEWPAYPSTFYTTAPGNVALNAGTGTVGDWGYSSIYGGQNQHWMPLYVYEQGDQKRDSAYTFVVDIHSPNQLRMVKTSMDNIRTGYLNESTILFEFVQPAPRVLSAEDYNTKMGLEQLNGTKGRILAFDPKPNYTPADPNADLSTYWKDMAKTAPWHYLKLYAEKANEFTPSGTGAIADKITDLKTKNYNKGNWLYFRVAKNEQYQDFDDWNIEGQYLHVDTNYYGAVNSEYLKFNFSSLYEGIRANTKAVSAIPGITFEKLSNGKTVIAARHLQGIDERYPNDSWYTTFTQPQYVSDFINQYRFQATYFWYNDSLAIDVLQANMKPRTWSGNDIAAPATPVDQPADRSWYLYEPISWQPPYFEWAIVDGRWISTAGGLNAASHTNLATPQYGDNHKANIGFLTDRLTGNKATEGDYLHVKLADLPNNAKYLSIGGRTIGTTMGFGLDKCSGSAETSIPEGVYVIRNIGLDKYLTVPINRTYTDDDPAYDGAGENYWRNYGQRAEWVTPRYNDAAKVMDVDPMRMPSYHWIVKKVDKLNGETSPINLINREFPEIIFRNVKLVKDEDGFELTGNGLNLRLAINNLTDRNNATAATASFQLVPADLLKLPYLGYYKAPSSTAEQKFDLNYFNWAFETEPQVYFLDKAERDSTLRVSRARTLQFRFQEYGKVDNKYGYTPTAYDTEDLVGVQLLRRAYYLEADFYENGQKVTRRVRVNAEGRYMLERDDNSTYPPVTPFLFKTQNVGKNVIGETADFYAMVQVSFSYATALAKHNNVRTVGNYYYRKPGASSDSWVTSYVADFGRLNIMGDVLWAYQNVNTSSVTSTFAVTQYTPPIYRRFDGGKYTYNNKEDARATTEEAFKGGKGNPQGPLYLKFRNVIDPQYYLFENTNEVSDRKPNGNPYRSELKNTALSFLGTQNALVYPELLKAEKEGDYVTTYTFYVDTAFSARTADGKYVANPMEEKAHATLTPKPQYMLALNPSILPARKIWWGEGSHVWLDAEGKPLPGQDWTTPDYNDPVELTVKAMTIGDYLFNAIDSIAAGNLDYQGKAIDNIGKTTRLSFIRGAHVGDTFYVLTGTQYGNTNLWSAEKIQVYDKLYGILSSLPVFYKHYLGRNDHFKPRFADRAMYSNAAAVQKAIAKAKSKITKTGDEFNTYFNTNDDDGKKNKYNGNSMVFQFRLANISDYENIDRKFYIESRADNDEQYAPEKAYFLQEINRGAVVVNAQAVNYNTPSIDLAPLGFQVDQKDIELDDKGDAPATANEAASLSDAARVISGVNQISILNAAGKTVTVTNVLGQTVAKTVATSDNATITLPKGIVVVSVDGKSTKAVVK
jgi:hypothetical protein